MVILINHGADMTLTNYDRKGNNKSYNKIFDDNFVDIAFKDKYIRSGDIKTWFKTCGVQRYLLTKCPTLYFTFKKYDILCKDVENDFKYIESGTDLNLL